MSMKLTHDERKMLSYVRRYPEWVDAINTMSTVHAIAYDGDKVQTSPQDMMLDIAIKIEDYQERINKVEYALRAAYVTDEMVNKMRLVWCYGKRDLNRYEIYRGHKLFARILVDKFLKTEGETNESNTI